TDALRGILQVGVPLLSIVVAGGTWVVVGRALAPVESIRREVASIGGQQLDRRVPVPRSRDEIARLAETMNEMLGRLQDAYQRQERFVADAAHELRSPLASLRVQLEVDGDEGTRHLLDEVIRMQRLVDDLLILARSDAGQLATQSSSVDLDDIVLGVAVRLREIGSRAAVDTSAVSAGQVRGNAEQLLRVVRNLLENAVRHAAAQVVVTLRDADGEVVLTVQDDGPGVPPAERSRIFERFARADSARARGSGGAGLGLAIARTIAESHGGTLGLDDTDGGASFVLRLPAAN
ncbi:MAG: HAMP domain-containing protein, partial [Dehalococcoidia bacterium]|nr:HAMP domain-containing protein [Dehalococcoidia bacterium]